MQYYTKEENLERKMIADKIAQLQQEKRLLFDVPVLLNLKRFPKSFFALQIHELRLSRLPKDFEWESLDVQPMPTVKRLNLRTYAPQLLPQLPYLFPNLVELRLYGQYFDKTTDFSFFSQLQALETLDLEACHWKNIQQLPDSICQLSKLKRLHILYFHGLSQLGKNFSQLTSLEDFSAPSAQLKVQANSPLLQLPQLRKLCLRDTALQEQPQLLLQFPALHYFKRGDKSAKATPLFKDFVTLFNAAQKNHYKVDFLQDCLNYLEQPEKELPNLSSNELIELLDLPLSNFRNKVFTELEKHIQKNLPELKAGTKIVLKGKFKGNKRELKEQLKELELIPKNKITAKTQLLVLGDLPKIEGDPLTKYPQIKILSEKSLLQLLEQKGEACLKEAASQELQNLKELLLSEDPEMIRLGLYMLEQGGCPTELRAALFVLYKTNKDNKIKQLALAQIERISPRSFSTVVKKRWKLFSEQFPELHFAHTIDRYIAAAPNELEIKSLLEAFYKRTGIGALKVIQSNDPEWMDAFFAEDLAKNTLYLLDLGLSEIPKHMLSWTQVERLDISGNNFDLAIPKSIAHFQNLKELVISYTPPMKPPAALFPGQDLKIQTLQEVPQEIFQLPKLKVIYLSHDYISYSLDYVLKQEPMFRKLQQKGVEIAVFR
ncbi:hypothetical protein PPO43_14575 [Saprospira sp. CCB-QB6]|uniref:hypothetical protein n=1 Tax=Saprospira sp. CCB-QB6 TaxID=3023936 RepID=UPI002349C025|nr:hypothetical protein [Saprospira sp. CCB-QB6]WCL81197.1 hypothetical protein PPO43_14575 [Saprospira sp. CCB-QB6]